MNFPTHLLHCLKLKLISFLDKKIEMQETEKKMLTYLIYSLRLAIGLLTIVCV